MRRHALFVSAAGLLALSLGGCPYQDQRLINQGGGSIISAVGKLATGEMSDITPDELQIIADTISEVNPDVDVNITDDEALAGIEFIRQNKINSFDDVSALIQRAQQDPKSVVVPPSLMNLANSGVTLDDLVHLSDGGSLFAREAP